MAADKCAASAGFVLHVGPHGLVAHLRWQIRQNERVSVPNPVARRALCSWDKGKALPFDRRVVGPCAFPCCWFFVFLFAKLLNLFCFQDGWTPPQSQLSCKRGGLWEWIWGLNKCPECVPAAPHCVCWGNEGRGDEGGGVWGLLKAGWWGNAWRLAVVS